MDAAIIGLISVVLGLITYITMSRTRRNGRLPSAEAAAAVTDADAHIRASLQMVRTELGLVRADLVTTHAELKNVRADIRHALESNEKLAAEITRLLAQLDRRTP